MTPLMYVQFTRCAKVEAARNELDEMIQNRQKDISRLLGPEVQTRMQPAYDNCNAERGPGSFQRMRGHMGNHIETSKSVIFDGVSTSMAITITHQC